MHVLIVFEIVNIVLSHYVARRTFYLNSLHLLTFKLLLTENEFTGFIGNPLALKAVGQLYVCSDSVFDV